MEDSQNKKVSFSPFKKLFGTSWGLIIFLSGLHLGLSLLMDQIFMMSIYPEGEWILEVDSSAFLISLARFAFLFPVVSGLQAMMSWLGFSVSPVIALGFYILNSLFWGFVYTVGFLFLKTRSSSKS